MGQQTFLFKYVKLRNPQAAFIALKLFLKLLEQSVTGRPATKNRKFR